MLTTLTLAYNSVLIRLELTVYNARTITVIQCKAPPKTTGNVTEHNTLKAKRLVRD